MVTAASLLITLIVLYITYFISKRWKFFKLPSPGLELPMIGEILKRRTAFVQGGSE